MAPQEESLILTVSLKGMAGDMVEVCLVMELRKALVHQEDSTRLTN